MCQSGQKSPVCVGTFDEHLNRNTYNGEPIDQEKHILLVLYAKLHQLDEDLNGKKYNKELKVFLGA